VTGNTEPGQSWLAPCGLADRRDSIIKSSGGKRRERHGFRVVRLRAKIAGAAAPLSDVVRVSAVLIEHKALCLKPMIVAVGGTLAASALNRSYKARRSLREQALTTIRRPRRCRTIMRPKVMDCLRGATFIGVWAGLDIAAAVHLSKRSSDQTTGKKILTHVAFGCLAV